MNTVIKVATTTKAPLPLISKSAEALITPSPTVLSSTCLIGLVSLTKFSVSAFALMNTLSALVALIGESLSYSIVAPSSEAQLYHYRQH